MSLTVHNSKTEFVLKSYVNFNLPPETRTPSEFTANVLIIALWPERFWMKFPSGNFHCFTLSGDPDANVYL